MLDVLSAVREAIPGIEVNPALEVCEYYVVVKGKGGTPEGDRMALTSHKRRAQHLLADLVKALEPEITEDPAAVLKAASAALVSPRFQAVAAITAHRLGKMATYLDEFDGLVYEPGAISCRIEPFIAAAPPPDCDPKDVYSCRIAMQIDPARVRRYCLSDRLASTNLADLALGA